MPTPKSTGLNEAQFLSLLQRVLPKTTSDAHLATTIYEEVAREVRLINSLKSFEKFCQKGALPNLEPATVTELQQDLSRKFGETNVVVTPDEEKARVEVEIVLPDRTVSSSVRVDAAIADAEEEVKTPFVPFPVALPEDPELVWVLARREDLAPEEAARALSRIEQEFWETKKGQQLQRDRVEKSFAEFVTYVPAASLAESGLKRHYKEPEPLHALRLLTTLVPAAKE